MKRLLFISSRPLYPVIGGDQIRTIQSLNLLSRYFTVDVVCIVPGKEMINPQDINSSIHQYDSFKVSKLQHIFLCLRFLFNQKPLQVNYYYSLRVKRFIDRHLSQYDAVFCNNIRTAEYVVKATGIIKYIDFVDAISMNYEKARKRAKWWRKWIYSVDYRRCRRYEKYVLQKFDSCAVISEVDKQYILN